MSVKPDLSRTVFHWPDLTGVNLSNTDLSNVDLDEANLSGADLFKAVLTNANLAYANLSRVDLTVADLSGADLRYADLTSANLSHARLVSTSLKGSNLFNVDLTGADLTSADLTGANLENAKLIGANLVEANLTKARLVKVDLSSANLTSANLTETNLTSAVLIKVDLTQSICIDTILDNAKLLQAEVFGISAWGIKKVELDQRDLVITKKDKPKITVDNLEVAQFIYLMLNNQNIRDIIDTLTSKSVLILGRFSDARKPLLDTIKNELRKRNYLPILFDFEKPVNRDLTETISILARMSRFVIADLTDAKSISQELSHFVSDTFLPVVPIILQEQREYGMFEHFKRYDWVLPIQPYETPEAMLASIVENVIEPAERKVVELRERRK